MTTATRNELESIALPKPANRPPEFDFQYYSTKTKTYCGVRAFNTQQAIGMMVLYSGSPNAKEFKLIKAIPVQD